MKTDLFQSCDHCWVFQMCWHIECSTFTASSFRIWNSSTGQFCPITSVFKIYLKTIHSSVATILVPYSFRVYKSNPFPLFSPISGCFSQIYLHFFFFFSVPRLLWALLLQNLCIHLSVWVYLPSLSLAWSPPPHPSGFSFDVTYLNVTSWTTLSKVDFFQHYLSQA